MDLFQIERDEDGRVSRVEVDLWEVAIVVLVVALVLHWIFG